VIDSQHYHVDESKRKKTVCVHWLKGTCKKNDDCEFLHSYDPERIPPCKWWQKEGRCAKGEECYYRHISPMEDKKAEECPYYERGFCKGGNRCYFQHIYRKICEDYAYGFCPKGPECEKHHPKSVI